MAFKSTANRSHLRIVREVEAIGASVAASTARDQIGYTFDALKTHVPEMVELLIDCVRNPVFMDWEVNEELQKVKEELKELSKNPQGSLLEAIHSAGFSCALSNPLFAPESARDKLNSDALEHFVSENYTSPRMVLAASGVEHEELVSLAEPLLSDLPSVNHSGEPQSVYVGGDYRCKGDPEMTHIALAFEVPGGWHKEREAIILTVLQVLPYDLDFWKKFNVLELFEFQLQYDGIEMLMGGGGSFSAGGPGKGMHSRLYLRVLNEYQQMHSFSAFKSLFNHTGLFGIYASTGSHFAHKAVDIAAGELISIATLGKISQEELNRAKKATKSAYLMNLESRMNVSEEIGRQVLTYGERKPVDLFLKAVEEVTLNDITNIAEKIISSPVTMALYGDVASMPSYDSVNAIFYAK